MILSNLSLAHQHLSEWDIAHQRLSESLLIFSAHDDGSRSPTEWDYYAKILNTQGWLHWRQGQAQEAHDSWQQATHAYQLANNISGILGSQINQAQALQALDLSAEAMEQLATVATLLEQQPDSFLKVTGFHHLGNALRRIGKLEQSVNILEEAIALLDKQHLPTEQAERHLKLESALLLGLSNTYRAQWERATELNLDDIEHYRTLALDSYQRAIAFAPSHLQRIQAQTNLMGLMIASNKNQQMTYAKAELSHPSSQQFNENALIIDLWHQLKSELTQLPASRTGLEVKLSAIKSLLDFNDVNQQRAASLPIPMHDIITPLQQTIHQAQELQDRPGFSWQKVSAFFTSWQRLNALPCKAFKKEAKNN